jgi:hypothetical protein
VHQRTAIRTFVRDLLKNGGTAAGTRVHKFQVDPRRLNQLPALSVYILEEAVEDDSKTTAPRELERRAPLVIEGWVGEQEGTDIDDALDALALEVETLMHADPYLGGTVGAAGAVLEDTAIAVLEQGDRRLGMVALVYGVTYYTLAPEPPADDDLDDFLTVEATHNPGGEVHEDDQDVDEFPVRPLMPTTVAEFEALGWPVPEVAVRFDGVAERLVDGIRGALFDPVATPVYGVPVAELPGRTAIRFDSFGDGYEALDAGLLNADANDSVRALAILRTAGDPGTLTRVWGKFDGAAGWELGYGSAFASLWWGAQSGGFQFRQLGNSYSNRLVVMLGSANKATAVNSLRAWAAAYGVQFDSGALSDAGSYVNSKPLSAGGEGQNLGGTSLLYAAAWRGTPAETMTDTALLNAVLAHLGLV